MKIREIIDEVKQRLEDRKKVANIWEDTDHWFRVYFRVNHLDSISMKNKAESEGWVFY